MIVKKYATKSEGSSPDYLSTDLMLSSRTKGIHMDIRCAKDWIFHEWGADGRCIRCRVTGFRGTQNAATSAGDLSLAVVPLRVHPAGLASLHDSAHLVAHPRLQVQKNRVEDDSSSASSASSRADSKGFGDHLQSLAARLFLR